ncbi:MAG: hypothetical protein WAV46_00130 [Candidatus Moraniibacteriota bacterium]
METKKTTRTKKENVGTGWTGLLLESVVKGIQSSFDGAVERAHQAVHVFTRKVTRRLFLFSFAFLGVIFLLVGLSQLMSAAYQFPGSGEVIMGAFILLLCLVVYVFDRQDH